MGKVRLITAAACALGLALTSANPAAAATVVNTVDNGNGWYSADTRTDGTMAFMTVDGRGAVQLSTPSNPAKVQLLTDELSGTKLADISAISYSTYRDPASTGFVAGLPALNARVDTDGDGVSDAYLVYEPYQDQGNAAVQTGVWQDWDAYRDGAAVWWLNTGAGGCAQSARCTWSTIVAALPDATILEGTNFAGSFGLNQGSFNSGIIGAVDKLSITAGGVAHNYDFVAKITLAAKEQCKDGGWAASNDPTFVNQGDCVSYFATGGKTHPRS